MGEKTAPPDERLDASGNLSDTAALLYEVFHDPRFRDTAYLEWFYRKNPAGPAIETDLRDDAGRLGHIGGIPNTYHSRSGRVRSTFPINVAVAERARGKGALRRLTNAHWQQAFARFDRGTVALGMANANSAHYYSKYDGYLNMSPMPVTICPPVWPSLSWVRSRNATPEYLASSEFAELVASLDLEPTEGWGAAWDLEMLKWRLSTPNVDYAVHVAPKVVVVSRGDTRKGVPFTIVMKTFRRKAAQGRRVTANAAIAAACRHRLSPAAVYAGFSATCRVVGVSLPEKYKPSPLNLCMKSLHEGDVDWTAWRYDVFEFLDFDVY